MYKSDSRHLDSLGRKGNLQMKLLFSQTLPKICTFAPFLPPLVLEIPFQCIAPGQVCLPGEAMGLDSF